MVTMSTKSLMELLCHIHICIEPLKTGNHEKGKDNAHYEELTQHLLVDWGPTCFFNQQFFSRCPMWLFAAVPQLDTFLRRSRHSATFIADVPAESDSTDFQFTPADVIRHCQRRHATISSGGFSRANIRLVRIAETLTVWAQDSELENSTFSNFHPSPPLHHQSPGSIKTLGHICHEGPRRAARAGRRHHLCVSLQ